MKLNILMASPQKKSKYLGISRVLMELQEGLEKRGHQVTLICPEDLGMKNNNFQSVKFRNEYAEKLKNFIVKKGEEYDVIDYDHEYLPFARSLFPKKTLMTTRSVLLAQHLKYIFPKKPQNLRSFLGKLYRYPALKKRLNQADVTVRNADLINVPNNHDKNQLISMGIEREKIVVIPYGLSEERVEHFEGLSELIPKGIKVCFLGSFDYRKGCAHFNSMFSEIKLQYPEAKLLLLGCGGMLKSREQVLDFFDKRLHESIETVFKFEREEIKDYLADCTVGIYPSYMEGFPFGILEMMLAYMPVFAFDAPGAPMMVKESFLCPMGDSKDMTNKVMALIENPEMLLKERLSAREKALSFKWEDICDATERAYLQGLRRIS